MNLDEAIKKYSIQIPTDEVFYSEEYQDYFQRKTDKVNQQFEKYRLFQEMYEQCFHVTFDINNESNHLSTSDGKAVILGGQTGAGKSGLVSITKKEFHEHGMEIFLIDDDLYRLFYPKVDEILRECPEYFVQITAIGSRIVTPRLMKYASDNHLNFIFDGTLKNKRIIETSRKWEGYDLTFKIMATSRINSLISMFERNENLRKLGQGRLITTEAHDETYYGLPSTVSFLEKLVQNGELNGHIQVYSRGEKCDEPKLEYDSMTDSENERKYPNAYIALEEVRAQDRQKCIDEDAFTRIKKIEKAYDKSNVAVANATKEFIECVKREMGK